MTNRPIKFRAWRKYLKEMDYNPSVSNSGVEDFDINDIGRDEDQILMQFTGLLDKNGKEIYEGDLVKTGKYGGIVRWENKLSRFELSDKFDAREAYVSLTEPIARKSEVIGNVYENPELLPQ